MNGRIYDPVLGRFMQADPNIQGPKNSQSYNRYSYLMNNPLSGTDPTGYIGSFFRKIVGAITNGIVGELIARVIQQARILLQAAACFYGGPIGCAASSFGNTIAAGGSLKSAFTNATFAYASAKAFTKIGAAFDGVGGAFWATKGVGHIATHAVTGGVISTFRGGKFGHGFFSAGLTKAANVNGIFSKFGEGWDAVRTITAAVIGGTISKISGGKFANGAATAAFAQHFNGNSAIEDPDVGGFSPASGEYATDNGGRLEQLEAKAGSALLTDQAGNSYGFDPETGIASLMFEAGNGGATSVAPEAHLMGLAAGSALVKGFRYGMEFNITKNIRIAPFGNRNPNIPNFISHKYGRWPHYHRKGPTIPKGQRGSGNTMPGQSKSRHRPFEASKHDKSFRDRF